MRISELTKLSVRDVNLETGRIKVIGVEDEDRNIPIHPVLHQTLSDYVSARFETYEPYSRFFATEVTDQLSPSHYNRLLQEAVKTVGWNKDVTAHTFRHSFATNLGGKKVAPHAIQHLLGHAPKNVTFLYMHVNEEELVEAINLLWKRERFVDELEWNQGAIDSRMEEILNGLRKGMSRSELAQKFGNKNRHAVDQYMRRRNYVWSEPDQTYVKSKKHPQYSQAEERFVPEKVRRILLEFRSVTADAREVARRVGFKDHREMANYMRENGFNWSQTHHNYIRAGNAQTPKEKPGHAQESDTVFASEDVMVTEAIHSQLSIERPQISSILQMLYENRDRLVTLLQQTPPRALTVPRYNVGGGYITKTLHMHAALEEMVRDFSQEKTIPQREIFEVALIQFFYRYGYGKKVEAVLSQEV
jgi:Phage integrase family